MKRMKTLIPAAVALSLVLGLSSMGFAQGNAPAPTPKHEKGAWVFKTLDPNNTGKITREAFMAEAQNRAMKRWEKIDPNGKGFVTREEYMAARGHKGHHKHEKPATQQ